MLNKHLSFLSILWLSLLLTAISAMATPTYRASGVAIHQCSCAYACPCMFENGPDNCALAAIYHLEAARYAGVDISGLNMISIDGAVEKHGNGACCAKTHSETAKTNAPSGVVYLDARATPAQRSALLGLLEAHGEWPGAGRPVRSVPISFVKTADGYKTTVPGLFSGEAKRVLSRKGAPIIVEGVGFVEGPRWVVGRSVVNDLHDTSLGLHWHLPGTNGSWSQFDWSH